jgi:hypothetical protein
VKQFIFTGGLMRCCTGTFDVYEVEPTPGQIIPCRHCSGSMIVNVETVRGEEVLAWRWNKPTLDEVFK